MSGRHLYILDFDHTVFDTNSFFKDVQEALIQNHRLDVDEFAATRDEFIDPEAGGYDPHSHHQKLLGLNPDELDEFIMAKVGDQDYTYPDASQWLSSHIHKPDTDVIVMTVGRPRFQELKFHHAPLLRELRKFVVATNKGGLIRHHLTRGAGEYGLDFLDQPYASISLIDDSVDTFTALGPVDRVQGIRIARPGGKYSKPATPPHVRHITSFGDLS